MIGSMSAQIVVARPVGSARNAKLKGPHPCDKIERCAVSVDG
jgi:hypothetical protein